MWSSKKYVYTRLTTWCATAAQSSQGTVYCTVNIDPRSLCSQKWLGHSSGPMANQSRPCQNHCITSFVLVHNEGIALARSTLVYSQNCGCPDMPPSCFADRHAGRQEISQWLQQWMEASSYQQHRWRQLCFGSLYMLRLHSRRHLHSPMYLCVWP